MNHELVRVQKEAVAAYYKALPQTRNANHSWWQKKQFNSDQYLSGRPRILCCHDAIV
jgi:hypothetical protein